MSPHILVFDSGIGGTSVLQHIEAQIPSAQFSYVMDNALLPYGLQSDQTIQRRLRALIKRIEQQSLAVDLIVIACNTASTAALSATRELTTIPIVGVVPAIKPAVMKSANQHIALLATPATSNNAYTQSLINEFAQGCQVDRHHSTTLVTLSETLYWQQNVDKELIFSELGRLCIAHTVDVIVLGCTHFPVLKPHISAFFGEGVELIDSGEAIARRVESLLRLSAKVTPSCVEVIKKPMQFYATAPEKIIFRNGQTIALMDLNY